jgi:uncharacterized 2Fe-2S/4Fe-4S cluster protein (DUF4445 family)
MSKDGALSFSTIARKAPVGICGCGLIDAIALMLESGIIGERGAFAQGPGAKFRVCENVSINNRDVRQFQLAKSAIISGIRILCRNAGLSLEDVGTVYIAGGLGFFINKANAVKAGILPPQFSADKLAVCGNLSLKGAAQSLRDPAFLDKCRETAAKCRVINLAEDPAFMDEFTDNMLFPLF